ncbi:septation protein IspZ [bacterium]|nr:septation protein IspZ [bacterium]
MKTLMDMLPALAFLAAYLVYDIYVATIVLVVGLYLAVVVHWLRTREVHKMHLVAALLATVLGGLTLLLRDPMFIKLKPTAVYAAFAAILAGSHFIGSKPLMARIPPAVIPLPEHVWRKVNAAWAGFFVFCALLNLPIAFYLSEQTWVLVKTFGFTALMFLFIIAHIPFVYDYLPKEAPAAANDDGAPHA